jgi:hypothetical protein
LQNDLQSGEERNWGVVVFDYLSRRLDVVCQGLTRSIGGPWLLLMLWSWMRLPLARPLSTSETTIFIDWSIPDRDSCVSFDI